MPLRICFVCLGNICRSPMAAVVLRSMAADEGLDVDVDSAGTGSWHLGSGMNPSAQAVLARRGYDSNGHVARQFRPADFAMHDLVVGLDRHNVADLNRLAPSPEEAAKVRLLREFDPALPAADGPDAGAGSRDVPDPYGGSDHEFDEALDLIVAACRGLLTDLTAGSGR
ncbi:MAG: low molecular weight protein-tyrosine-phosphatase [Geodermatophilaceae bacterium]